MTMEVALSSPVFLDIQYEINEWTRDNIDTPVDLGAAVSQWRGLVDAYRDLGVKTHFIAPDPTCLELTFPGDSILIHEGTALVGRFRLPDRATEREAVLTWAEWMDYDIAHLPVGEAFEGNAECMRWRDGWLFGHGIRSTRWAGEWVKEVTGRDLIPIELREPFFHLDTAVAPLDGDTLLVAPDAISDESFHRLAEEAEQVVLIDREEAYRLAANSVAVGDTVLMRDGNPKLASDLRELGKEVVELPFTEAPRVGGCIKCHTLHLY